MPSVVYVAESFNAGVLAAVKVMAWEMHRRGWAITVVPGQRTETPANLPDLFPTGTKVHQVRWGQVVRPLRELSIIRTLRGLFREQQPDVIHLVSSRAGGAGRLAAWPRFSKRIAYSPQGWSFLSEDRSPVGRAAFWLIEWALARLGGTIVACSDGEAAYGRRLTRRCVVIENALAELPAKPLLGSRARIVGTIGRMCPQKDPAFFVDVVRETVRLDPDVRFEWVGDGELRPLLERARDEGLPIQLTGWLSSRAVESRLREWSVFLLTSRYEGMPFAILEALALGVAVVARDVVGSRDAVRDGVTGTLFRTPSDAVAAILRYLGDGDLRDRSQRAGRAEAISRFAATRLGIELDRLYESL